MIPQPITSKISSALFPSYFRHLYKFLFDGTQILCLESSAHPTALFSSLKPRKSGWSRKLARLLRKLTPNCHALHLFALSSTPSSRYLPTHSYLSISPLCTLKYLTRTSLEGERLGKRNGLIFILAGLQQHAHSKPLPVRNPSRRQVILRDNPLRQGASQVQGREVTGEGVAGISPRHELAGAVAIRQEV